MGILSIRARLFTVLVLLSVFVGTVGAKIFYVDSRAQGTGDGLSWQGAYTSLQDALTTATMLQKPIEIRVAQGVYKPDQGTGIKPGDREATFRLVSGVTVKGGYAGLAQPDPNAWDPASYGTILNGDLEGNDDFTWRATLTDNSSHIVTAVGVDATTVLEGLTITHGVYHMEYDRGGNPGLPEGGTGLYNESGSPLIRRCVFSSGYGSGVFNCAGSAARFEGCTFEDNYQAAAVVDYQSQSTFHECQFIRNHNAGISLIESTSQVRDCLFGENEATAVTLGAKSQTMILNSVFTANRTAVWGSPGSQVECTGCTFERNRTDEVPGGAAQMDHGSFTKCFFRGNSAKRIGAILAKSLELDRCVFVQNLAEDEGVVQCDEASIRQCLFCGNQATESVGVLLVNTGAVISNCTFVGNRANSWSIIRALGATKPVVLANCIFRDNTLFDSRWPLIMGNPKMAIRYSNVNDSPDLWHFVGEAVANIDVDPLFANPGRWDPNGTPNDPKDDFWVDGDYHLKSQAGRWDPNSQSWVEDSATSPCIDAGDPNDPIGEEPFPNGGRINMGAYGGTAEASKSYFGEPVCETIIQGDINGDCKVGKSGDAILNSEHGLDLREGSFAQFPASRRLRAR